MRRSAKRSCLVIGCGSLLRQDDAAGFRVAEQLARKKRTGFKSLAVHQLTPDLALDLSQADRVVFVDARDGHGPVGVQPLAEGPASSSTHGSSPAALLGLCRQLYGTCPDAWVVDIPTRDFELGGELTASTRALMSEAIERIEQLAGGEEGICRA